MLTAPPHPARAAVPAPVRLLDVVPALRDAIPCEDTALAHRALTVPARTFARGEPLMVPAADETDRPFTALIVGGLTLRTTYLASRGSGELLEAGDLIDADGADEDLRTLKSHTAYEVLEPVTLAVLGDRFRTAARRWPAVHDVVDAHRVRQSSRATRHLAALALPRVEDRIVAMFCDLADRRGRVTPSGVKIEVPLTHSIIGLLVAARRPTVSLALTELAETDRLHRGSDHGWVLRPDGR